MWYIAFTIGLFGSLHCIGMCGPLAIAFCNKPENNKYQNIGSAISYNLGRTITYSLLGLFFGLVSSFLYVAHLQKLLSISLGTILVITFLLSIDLDKVINKNSTIKKYHALIRSIISKVMTRSKQQPPIFLGLLNGLLPCGLVYLALAGALATGSIIGGMSFMLFFGLGTIPMLFALTTGLGFFPTKVRFQFRKILPYVTLCFGLFLIYRGVVVEFPAELDFWESLKNPVMCF